MARIGFTSSRIAVQQCGGPESSNIPKNSAGLSYREGNNPTNVSRPTCMYSLINVSLLLTFIMSSYTLYHFPFSLFSIMVRYAIALGQASHEAGLRIEEKIVDLHRDENLSEWYLTEINPKGQVSNALVYPMPLK
jgi:hypothetical protein